MSTDFRQSPEYQILLKSLRVDVEDLGCGCVGYVSRFFFFFPLKIMVIQGVKDINILTNAENVAYRNRCLSIKVAPRVKKDSNEAILWENELKAHNYFWDKSSIVPTKTILVDLSHSEEELLAEMKSKTRYNVRLALRRGVTTKVITGNTLEKDSSYLEDFLKVYLQNVKRLGMKGPNPKLFEKIVRSFKENLFIVYSYSADGELGAVASYIISKDTISYQMNASTEKGRRDFSTTLVVWEGMLEGKRRGCRWFDFEGIYDDRYPKEEEWEGFSRFKSGFGGEDVTFLGSFKKKMGIFT